MTHGCFDLPRTSLSLLLCAIAITAASCAPARSQALATEGSGGVIGSGGLWESGGSVGSGGDPVGTGGEDGTSAGGAVGAGGQDSGGTTGSGGTGPIPTDLHCTGDADCAASGLVCEPATKLCVPCVKTGDCPSGGHCYGNRCVTLTPCSSNLECSSDPICDLTRGVCVQCAKDSDCSAGQPCRANKCVAVETCKNNNDCPSSICDTANNVCMECLVDSHCGSGNVHCVRNVCRTACRSNTDCNSLGMVCDTSNSACVQCMSATDCPASWYCLVDTCVPDVCDSTQSACSGTSVASCNADGDGFDNFTSCAAGKPCSVRGAVAGCGGVPIRDAGAPDAPIMTSDAGSGGSCSGGTMADPCKSGIPKFSGTQTVDGNGSELCSLPYFVLNTQNAAKVITRNNAPISQMETATVRVAGDSAGFHAYVEVQDPSVQTAYMADPSQAVNKAYQGDSIELFIASSTDVTGLTSRDSNTLHMIIPANGPAVSVKDTGNSGTPTALPTNQYAQASTSAGYAIEVMVPWPGSAPSSGSAIRFDVGINSADKSFTNIDDMRDGQVLYYVGTVTATTCQTDDGTLPWCDDRTWCQANVQ
jgi:Cys-rich repeat protein